MGFNNLRFVLENADLVRWIREQVSVIIRSCD